MPYLPASLFMLGGLICILGGLYLLVDSSDEENNQTGSLVANIGKVLKLNVSNYGPGLITLLLGGGILIAGPYLYDIQYAVRVDSLDNELSHIRDSLRSLNSNPQTFTIKGEVRKKNGDGSNIDISHRPPHSYISNGHFEFYGIQRKSNGNFPELLFIPDSDSHETKLFTLDPDEAELKDQVIDIDSTITIPKGR